MGRQSKPLRLVNPIRCAVLRRLRTFIDLDGWFLRPWFHPTTVLKRAEWDFERFRLGSQTLMWREV